MKVLERRIAALLQKKACVLLAIDGPCAGGKTTLAAQLQRDGAAVVHMDDFFLQPHQRTQARLAQPGGNVDYERVEQEVLLPLSRGETARYRRYDCKTQALADEKTVAPEGLIVIEGSYSLHPQLAPYYDLRVFLRVSADVQAARLLEREGAEKYARFVHEWIPLENRYFEATDVLGRCDMTLSTEEQA